MDAHNDYGRALRNTSGALASCAACVTLGYFLVDRPVAFWVHRHGTENITALKWITYVPPVAETWSPLVLVLVMIRCAFGRVTRLESALLAAVIALMVADEFRESLSAVFGRTWPETWRDNNPSLIRDNTYGFHWFHTSSAYGSFPSGHMARTVAAAAVFWAAFPHWWVRLVALSTSLVMAVALVGMNYHFVTDVLAGSFLGAIVGAYAALLCEPPRPLQ